nr:hypothetical protein [uncultured Desulfobulbus sp.]
MLSVVMGLWVIGIVPGESPLRDSLKGRGHFLASTGISGALCSTGLRSPIQRMGKPGCASRRNVYHNFSSKVCKPLLSALRLIYTTAPFHRERLFVFVKKEKNQQQLCDYFTFSKHSPLCSIHKADWISIEKRFKIIFSDPLVQELLGSFVRHVVFPSHPRGIYTTNMFKSDIANG